MSAPHRPAPMGRLTAPHLCREARPRVYSAANEGAAARADAVAMSIGLAMHRLAVPLARAAAAFVAKRGWSELGYARLDDHARERFGRSGRWVRDLAALGEGLARLPGLEAALTGDDGDRALGRVAAISISRIATPDSAAAWIEHARRVTVRELKESIERARVRGDDRPEPVERAPRGGAANDEPGDLGDAPRDLLRLLVPAPVAAAFEEALDLFRAVEGSEASVTSFVEALVAEEMSGVDTVDLLQDLDRVPLRSTDPNAEVEAALARSTAMWRHLPEAASSAWALARAGASLRRFEDLSHRAGQGDATHVDGQIRDLASLEDELERRLGDLLCDMARQGSWRDLGFDGCAHYAEQRLGLSRTAASDRLRVARDLRRLPLVRDAYEAGEVCLESALHVLRALGDRAGDEAAQLAWLGLAREATVKRMRDEVRWTRRAWDGRHVAGDDAAWQALLRREPGMARARVGRLGLQALGVPDAELPVVRIGSAPGTEITERSRSSAAGPSGPAFVPDVFLRLRLPSPLASDLQAAMCAERRRMVRLAESIPWDEWNGRGERPRPSPEADPPASLLAARHFFIRCRWTPAWVGLLALIERFVETWDDPRSAPRRHGDAVFMRDGFRCCAPGCTSRRHLEDHHIVHRARGGDDVLSNRVTLCRFHHQRGEHGGLASCRGVAPLRVRWRIGRGGLGGSFLNERRRATV